MDSIVIRGARENNLKNIDLVIPKNKLVVMTGLSGSGKSTLAFDTIYQEGQRRYVESLSAYARQFLGAAEKPDVDSIEGLSPAISIDQKSTNKNPRSTVGTVTEIYDYLRLLYARIGVPYCPIHKEPITSQSIEEMVNKILEFQEGTKIQVLSPVSRMEKGTHKKDLEQYLKEGFFRARIDNETVEFDNGYDLDKNKKHNIDIVVDRLVVKPDIRSRLFDSIETAVKMADGKVIIDCIGDREVLFSEKYACKYCDYSLPDLEPRMFSFNSPTGACKECNGLGVKLNISTDLLINKELSIMQGAIKPYKDQSKNNLQNKELETVCNHFDIDMNIPFQDLAEEKQKIILYGANEVIKFKTVSTSGHKHEKDDVWEGIANNLERRYVETSSPWIREWIENYMVECTCPKCKGTRLDDSILNVFINGKNIYDVTALSIKDLSAFLSNMLLTETQRKIASLIVKEIGDRVRFLIDVGLDYLTLSRSAGTLSGGEAQRIRLATQIGSRLTGVLYVLDEPSIGLHQRDNSKLIDSLKKMRDMGNSLIVVEHDEDTMLAADCLIDIGPKAGIHGGEVVAIGTPQEVMDNPNSITGRYLSRKEEISIPKNRRKPTGYLEIIGATQNNLKNIDVKIPLGVLVLITGVSGSGKSTLINEILYKKVHTNLYKTKEIPGAHREIKNLDLIERVIEISQSPIGRTPRSNPATYTGVFDDIRNLYTATTESKIRGYDKGRFSFNVKGGRCEACWGDGVKRISMHFLPDVYVPCEVCGGTRFNRETLQVKYKGKSIADVLEMTIEEALEFFKNIEKISAKLQTLCDVGLGYIKLGQSAPSLSGGEAQRVKLASELHKKITPKTLYLLDEPTTGLHIDDIKRLMKVINRIVNERASVIIIEHNLDVIKIADHIIDLGPEGGDGGGTVVFQGTPEEIIKCEKSYTGKYLKKLFE